jgi:Arc/MetJ-type ribon-helix-helix transcriptional regulator
MAEIEVEISTQLDMQIEQMVEEGDFLTREEAIEELLSSGLRTYQTNAGDDDEGDLDFADEMRNPGDEPMGPAADDADGGDEYTF